MRVELAVVLLVAVGLAVPAAAAQPDVGPSGPAAPRLARLDAPRELRAVSYYPADAGWTLMWEPWRPDRLAADFRRLRSLNANTVRAVVSPPHFGYPEPEQRYLDRLGELVTAAAAAGLHVQLTLFDWWGEYADPAGSKRWASAVLAPYVGDARIAAVELRNEIDPADPQALAWAQELVPWLRSLLRGTPVTLSVGGGQPARDLRALTAGLRGTARPDFFSAHYFTGGGELAESVFRQLRAIAAPTPLWVGELGYPTSTAVSGYAGLPRTRSSEEAAQAHFLRAGFAAARHAGLPAPGIWILDDFEPGAIPHSDVSGREPEYSFGLFRSDGSPKAAAATVRRLFAGAREAGFNGGFEEAVEAEDGSSVPAVWAQTGGDGVGVVRDTAAARTGSASARLTSNAARSGYAQLSIAPIDGAVRTGRCAELDAWSRGTIAAGQARLTIGWFDSGSRRIGRKSSRLPLRGAGWKRSIVRSCPPAGAVYARLSVDAIGLHGVVRIDDVGFSWR